MSDDRVAFSRQLLPGNGLSLDEIQAGGSSGSAFLAAACERPSSIAPSSASKLRKGHVLPYGTARISVHSTFIVQSIYGAIQEYAGIDRPEWLDL